MTFTLSKCFSALVASGNGSQCNDLKYDLQSYLLTKNSETGEWNSLIYKFGSENPNIQKKLNVAVGHIVTPYVNNIDPFFLNTEEYE